jgi:hypothetical protein
MTPSICAAKASCDPVVFQPGRNVGARIFRQFASQRVLRPGGMLCSAAVRRHPAGVAPQLAGSDFVHVNQARRPEDFISVQEAAV